MKAQMKYADRRKSPCVVIQGSNEREQGEVQIKDLIEGAQGRRRPSAPTRNGRRRARRRFPRCESDMVAAVKEILERHGL